MSNDDPFDSTLDSTLDTSLDTGIEVEMDPSRELDAVLGDLEALLKNGEVIAALTARGINASLALVAAGGLRAYVKGKKADAADDFATVAEEIRARANVEAGRGGRRA
jgi:hypothetical protein